VDDAWATAERVRSREVSARELAQDALTRLPELDRDVNSVWLVTDELALEQADRVDAAVAVGDDPGELAGVTVGWKDLIDTAGIRSTYGSAIWRDHVPDRDADVVERLAAAGGLTIGKLATHELAWGTTTDNPWFGTCHNPLDTSRMPGGSSGGSGAAVAAGIVAVAPGTDTGGSIRCPASVCGIVGLKPTFGRVSLAGIHPLCPTLDHCGPMARSVRDCALLLELLAGPSARDPRTPPVPVEPYREALGRGVAGMTVGVAERYFFEHTQDDIAGPVRDAVEALREAGATLVDVDLGWPVGGLGDAGFYLGEEGAAVAGGLWPDRRDDLGPDVVRDLEAAERIDAVGAGDAIRRRLDYRAATHERLAAEGIDLIVSPTQAFTAPIIGTRTVPFAGNTDEDVTTAMCGLTGVFNVLGWPAITVPCGTDAAGMPVGIQLAALPWRESDVLAAASVLHH
jgi:aspartyl-tRNA(Asn)/glutamyl-tRNA(Gln) amidotransferase subunit A